MDHMWTELVAWSGPILRALVAAATSWLAQRIYVLAGAGAIVIASVKFASKQSADFFPMPRPRGRKPIRRASIQKALDKASRFQSARTLTFLRRTAMVVVFGFVVPSALLLLGVRYYAWFRPGAAPLLATNGCYAAAAHPSIWETAQFVASQLTMGITDSRLSGSLITGTSNLRPSLGYMPSDRVVSGMVVFYRYFIGAFTTLLIRLGLSTFRAVTSVDQNMKELQAELAKAS